MAPRGGLPIATAAGLDQLEQVNRNAAGIRPYKDQGAAYYEARYRERLVEGLRRRAKQLGLDVVSVATAP
jgi:hypothetical protein